MVLEIMMFILSIILFLFLIYLTGKIWFLGKKSLYLVYFLLMGVMCSLWALFNGFFTLLSEDTYAIIYPLTMLLMCFLPHVMLLYALSFANLKVARSKVLICALSVVALVDMVVLLTNPYHHLFITGYDGLVPTPGAFSPVHFIFSYGPLFTALGILCFCVLRNIKKNRAYLLMFLAILLPLVFNVLYSFELVRIGERGFDLTPFALLIMFGVFATQSIKLRLFNVQKAATENIFDTLNDAIMVVDSAGIIVDTNPSFDAIYKDGARDKYVEEVLGKLSESAFDKNPEDIFEQAVSGKEAVENAEFSIAGADGEVTNYALYRKDIVKRGKNAGYMLSISDISNYRKMIEEINIRNKELIELKEMAESASRAKSAFLANMSHEIRTPLNAIIGMTEISKNSDSLEKTSGYLNKIDGASKHLLNILNDILDMSKIEANKYEFNFDRFNFADMIGNITNMFSIKTKEKNQELITRISPDIPGYIISDQLRFSQILNNLLSNAVKFTPENGTVKLTADIYDKTEESARLVFTVEDDGIGISPEKQETIFNAFVQADAGISRQFGGTGLGLSISKNLAVLMGGDITLQSEEGKGSKFIFTVKVGLENNPVESIVDDYEEEDCDFSGKTFLLAEDIEINREIIIELMRMKNAQLECAENGIIACELFAANPVKYDLIFMDIHMPLMDGYTATAKIRDSGAPNAKSVPIIAMTANAFAEDIERCLNTGMNDHIAKPIDVDELFKKTAFHLKKV